MKRLVAILITILMFFSLFQGVLRENVVKADESYEWISVNSGLHGGIIRSLAIDPINTQVIYAGIDGNMIQGGVFKSTDGGASWTQINTELTNTYVYTLAIDPKNTQVVYAGTFGSGVFKSINGGSSWTQIGLSNVNALSIDPKNSQIIYSGNNEWGDGVYKSIDGGANWANTGLINNAESVAVNPIDTEVIYAGCNGGVFKSIDGGASWAKAGTLSDVVLPVVIDPINVQIIYVGKKGSVFKSTDDGENWTRIDTGLPYDYAYSLAIDPKNDQIVYVGTGQNGVFKSTDSGASWKNIGLSGAISSLAIDPTNTQVVYAGTDIGVFKLVRISTFTIQTSAGEGGAISPSGTVTANSGDSKAFRISPNSGYKISNVKVDSVLKGSISSYTFSNITSNHTIEATFEKQVTQTVIILQIGESTFTVNGIRKTLDSPPTIKNARTLLPIRAVIEALGGTVGWNATERKVTVTLGSTIIELWIGKSTAKVNGMDTPIDSSNSKVVPEIINSRTMLPLRFVAENVGATVDWEQSTQTITINYLKH